MRTVRTECLDWTLVWNRQHLQRVLTRYLEHYTTGRPRPVETMTMLPFVGGVECVDVLGGLIHEYERVA